MYTNNDKPKLNDEKALFQAKKTLEIFLPLEADGYCVTTDTLYDILIGIAANRGTTESVCAELAGAPDPETIRCYFREQFRVEQLQDLQRSINDGLAAHWPKKLRLGGPVEVAIDFHDRPYYGKQDQKKALWMRGDSLRIGGPPIERLNGVFFIDPFALRNHLLEIIKRDLKKWKSQGVNLPVTYIPLQ